MLRSHFNVEPVEHQDFVNIVSPSPWTEPYFQVYREWSLVRGFGVYQYFIYFSLFTCEFSLMEDD